MGEPKIVASFSAKSDTTVINQTLSPKLMLNPTRNYYLSLINVSYSNVFSNMLLQYYTHFIIIVDIDNVATSFETEYEFKPGMYELSDIVYHLNRLMLVSNYKAVDEEDATEQLATFKLDLNRARIVLTPNVETLIKHKGYVGFQNELPLSIFNSQFLELRFNNIKFDYELPETLVEYESVKQPSISTYNSLILNCNLLSFDSYVTESNGIAMSIKNQMYKLPAVSSKYEFNNYTAVQPLLYSLPSGCNYIDRIYLQLMTDASEDLVVVEGSNTDFSVYIQVIEY